MQVTGRQQNTSRNHVHISGGVYRQSEIAGEQAYINQSFHITTRQLPNPHAQAFSQS
jgi:hypothetical protein